MSWKGKSSTTLIFSGLALHRELEVPVLLLQDIEYGETLTMPLSRQEAEWIVDQFQGGEPQGFQNHFMDLIERQGWTIDSLEFLPVTGGSQVRLGIALNKGREFLDISPGEALLLSMVYGIDLTTAPGVDSRSLDCNLLAGASDFLFFENLFQQDYGSFYIS